MQRAQIGMRDSVCLQLLGDVGDELPRDHVLNHRKLSVFPRDFASCTKFFQWHRIRSWSWARPAAGSHCSTKLPGIFSTK